MTKNISRIFQIALLVTFLVFNNAYAQKDKTTLSFKTSVKYGKQANNLAVLVANDFKEDYTLEGVKSATWKDVSKKVNFASDDVPKASGEIDLSKNFTEKSPLYVAFKFQGQESERPSQRGWAVSDVTITHKGETKILAISEFKIVNNKDNIEGATWVKGADVMRFRSNQSTKATESWAIIKAVDK